MQWLNYHHLLYFWLTAKEGGVARAAAALRLSHPTVSAQIKTLEASLGEQLFEKKGRRLVLTEVGQVVYRYAEEIFGLGHELLDTLNGRAGARPLKLTVGIADVVSKLVARRLLEPVRNAFNVTWVCHEDTSANLLSRLAVHELDVIISDAPVPSTLAVKAFSHLLGETGVVFMAVPDMAKRLRAKFPGSLNAAPMVLPMPATSLRHSLDAWFDTHGIKPSIVAEVDDSALVKTFAQKGWGAVAAPAAIEAEVRRQYGLTRVGVAEGVTERYFVISPERRLKHPAVLALTQAARTDFLS